MSFYTKIDYSNNRQIKQNQQTFTILSGGTTFGLPYSGLTSGPNLQNTGVTSTQINLVATFSGNNTTTNYVWYDPSMELGKIALSAITPTTSAYTQNTGLVFTASSTTIIDGETVALSYSGVSFDLTPISFYEIGPSAYTGTVQTNIFNTVTASSLDYSSRMIWVDVCGITRTDKLIVTRDATFSNIGSLPSAGSLHYTSGGTLTVNTSDERLKTNITKIENPLDKVLRLNGVLYNWKSDESGSKRLGFIAQEVNKVLPEVVFSHNGFLGVHYDNVVAILVEAIKELSRTSKINVSVETEKIFAEDNNIQLNFNGNKETAQGGGIEVINGLGDGENANLLLVDNNWVTNVPFKPNGLFIPIYTPNSDTDDGVGGNICFDSNFLYIRDNIWKKVKLENL